VIIEVANLIFSVTVFTSEDITDFFDDGRNSVWEIGLGSAVVASVLPTALGLIALIVSRRHERKMVRLTADENRATMLYGDAMRDLNKLRGGLRNLADVIVLMDGKTWSEVVQQLFSATLNAQTSDLRSTFVDLVCRLEAELREVNIFALRPALRAEMDGLRDDVRRIAEYAARKKMSGTDAMGEDEFSARKASIVGGASSTPDVKVILKRLDEFLAEQTFCPR